MKKRPTPNKLIVNQVLHQQAQMLILNKSKENEPIHHNRINSDSAKKVFLTKKPDFLTTPRANEVVKRNFETENKKKVTVGSTQGVSS